MYKKNWRDILRIYVDWNDICFPQAMIEKAWNLEIADVMAKNFSRIVSTLETNGVWSFEVAHETRIFSETMIVVTAKSCILVGLHVTAGNFNFDDLVDYVEAEIRPLQKYIGSLSAICHKKGLITESEMQKFIETVKFETAIFGKDFCEVGIDCYPMIDVNNIEKHVNIKDLENFTQRMNDMKTLGLLE